MIHMNQELFDKHVYQGDKPVLVDFWAPWCVYCRRIAPAMAKIDQQFSDILDIAQVNIDDHPVLARQEQIEVIPTLVLYRGGEVLGSIVVPESKAKIEAFIRDTLEEG